MTGDPADDDTTQVWRDDVLLAALARGDADMDVTELPRLVTWRQNLDAAPLPPLDTRVVDAAADAAARTMTRWGRRGVAIAFTAAVLAAGGGVAAAAVSGPTGPLGPLHRALFGSNHHDSPSSTHPTTAPSASAADVPRHVIDRTGAPAVSGTQQGARTDRRTPNPSGEEDPTHAIRPPGERESGDGSDTSSGGGDNNGSEGAGTSNGSGDGSGTGSSSGSDTSSGSGDGPGTGDNSGGFNDSGSSSGSGDGSGTGSSSGSDTSSGSGDGPGSGAASGSGESSSNGPGSGD